MYNIIIADDHSIVRLGIKQLLAKEFPFALIDEAPDGETVLKLLSKREYQMLVLDISMPGRSGLDSIEQIKLTQPSLPILILTAQSKEMVAVRTLTAGAAGFISKDASPEELLDAFRSMYAHQKYIPPTIGQLLIDGIKKGTEKQEALHLNLTNREFEILKSIASGESLSSIAVRMSLAITTVSSYRTRILKKMNLETNAQLTMYAMKNNIL